MLGIVVLVMILQWLKLKRVIAGGGSSLPNKKVGCYKLNYVLFLNAFLFIGYPAFCLYTAFENTFLSSAF
jgi:hypothetical protein